MERKNFEEYKKKNPYHVWVHGKGYKFVGHFKNRKDAEGWSKSSGEVRIGKETTASKTKKRRKKINNFGISSFPLFRVPKIRI